VVVVVTLVSEHEHKSKISNQWHNYHIHKEIWLRPVKLKKRGMIQKVTHFFQITTYLVPVVIVLFLLSRLTNSSSHITTILGWNIEQVTKPFQYMNIIISSSSPLQDYHFYVCTSKLNDHITAWSSSGRGWRWLCSNPMHSNQWAGAD